MKYLKYYESLNDNIIDSICWKYHITNYTINSDGSIDVDGSVVMRNKGLFKLPLKFGRISGSFFCSDNYLTDLENFPSYVDGYFYCDDNPVDNIWKLFRDYSKIELFNDYDIIRGNSIVLDRLNDFLLDIGKPTVAGVKGYINI